MTDSNPRFGRLAFFVIDVQKHLVSGPDAVPDASEIRQAINDTLESVRQHNDLVELEPHESARKTRIIFVQHDDKDPDDPLYKGKPTWELEFNPRKDDNAEALVSKDVGNVFESNPQLAQELRLQGITEIAVAGVQSDCCVRASILGAIASGFDAGGILLLQGAHSTYNDASAGKFYSQIKKDVEEQLGTLGVELMRWQDFIW